MNTDAPLLVSGPNFSGRTDLLLDAVRTPHTSDHGNGPTAYIGPEVYNSISALAVTVAGELMLHAGRRPVDSEIGALVSELGLDRLSDRNPFTLSGGEQVALCICAALALSPSVLCVDCVLEQLDASRVEIACAALGARSGSRTSTLIADNRLSDQCFFKEIDLQSFDLGTRDRVPFGRIRGDVEFPRPPRGPRPLTLAGISYRYNRFGPDILIDLDWDLTPGTVYHLSGVNGSGKSTLAKILAGVIRPRSGEIKVENSLVSLWRQPGRLAGYHFQNPDVQLFSTSVQQEIDISAHAGGFAQAERGALIQAAIEALSLRNVLHEHPLELPFAMRKRVALAATVAAGTPWIVLDEPTLGQDSTNAHAMALLIKNLANAGYGVIIVSHSDWFTAFLDGRRIHLEDGKLKRATC